LLDRGSGNNLILANEGNDTINVSPGVHLVFAGQNNDSVVAFDGSGTFFLNEGADTFTGIANTFALTVQGGNDSADGNDCIITGAGADVVLGNGGLDIIDGGDGNNVLVGGFGSDTIEGGDNADLMFGNQDNDTINMGGGSGADTVFAGQGNDIVFVNSGVANARIDGNEGNDTIDGGEGADTVTGGAGLDRFLYFDAGDDGNGAAGGAIEFVTDVNFSEERFYVGGDIEFAATASAGAATNLTQAATNALAAVHQMNNSAPVGIAALFTFQGRTYVAADRNGFTGQFVDANDILIDVSGATGTFSQFSFAHS
jgi:Ca2+-binding RTX toxin-like protein